MSRRLRWTLGLLAVLIIAGVVRAATVSGRPARPATAAPYPLVWAHQGASGHRPSNTLESFRLAVAMGADYLETDLQVTRDGVLVLSHDETVDRLTDGQGRIAGMTLAQVQALDAGYRFVAPDGKSWRGQGVRIPTLDEFLSEFAPLDGGRLRFSLELKTSDPPMEELLWAAIRKHKIEDRIVVGSFKQEAIDKFRQLSGGRVATAGAPTEMYFMAGFWKTGLGALWEPRMDAFVIPVKSGPLRTDNRSLTSLAHRKGMKVVYWTINEEAQMRHLLEIGADGLITDFPDRAIKVMRELGLRQ